MNLVSNSDLLTIQNSKLYCHDAERHNLIHISITNNLMSLIVDQHMAQVLDQETCYPSPTVKMLEYTQSTTPGGWDGWIHLLRARAHDWVLPTGLFPLVQRLADKHGYQLEIQDLRRAPDLIPAVGEPWELRDYQLRAVEAAIAAKRGVLDMPPRAGKTRVMCEIQRRLGLPAIWITPTDRITSQTVERLVEHLGPEYAEQLVGSRDWKSGIQTPVVCATAATAVRLPPDFWASRQLLIVDEFHHAAAASYRKIFKFADHIYYRLGMTGTFFRSGSDDLAMHGLLSTVIYKVSSAELLRLGYLVPTDVLFLPVPTPTIRGVAHQWHGGYGTHGVHEHPVRNQLVALAASLLAQHGKRVLVLVGTKAQSRILREMILQNLGPGQVEVVSTDVPRPRIRKILENFTEGLGVQVLIGTTLIGEGIDLPSADALVYARGEKAEVSLTQAAYRVCTAVAGKTRAVIVDFADNHHRVLRDHARERLRVFFEEPTFQVQVLEAASDLGRFIEEGERHVEVQDVRDNRCAGL